MTEDFKPILTARYGIEGSETLAVAEKHGVYSQARRALTTMSPEQIKDEVKEARSELKTELRKETSSLKS